MKNMFDFKGGSIKLVREAQNQKLPSGEIKSWDRSVKIIRGKTEIKVGKDFFNLAVDLFSDPEFQEFIKDID